MNINRYITTFLLAAWLPWQMTLALPDVENLYVTALTEYEAEQYEAALVNIKQAVEIQPDNSEFHHLLGKCYGRLAQQANPLKAFSLTQKTRHALEKAVELDDRNISALRDLMEYYRQAPGFMGGNRQKADEIERLLKEIDTTTS